jgi:hypothetical protein
MRGLATPGIWPRPPGFAPGLAKASGIFAKRPLLEPNGLIHQSRGPAVPFPERDRNLPDARALVKLYALQAVGIDERPPGQPRPANPARPTRHPEQHEEWSNEGGTAF